MKIIAFQSASIVVYTMCFIETVHDKECMDKSVEQTEHDLERAGFVKNWLNSVEIIRPSCFPKTPQCSIKPKCDFISYYGRLKY